MERAEVSEERGARGEAGRTARLTHLWYHKHHVLGEPDEISRARLALARAAQIVLRNGLTILGISAPERM